MELKKISFCDTNCSNVCSNAFKKMLTEELTEKYEIRQEDRSVRIYDPLKHRQLLLDQQYLTSVKSIGNTYLLYLTQFEGVNVCFLIDKKILKGYLYPRVIFVRYRFNDHLYKGTLMEGDLIKTDKGWKFVLSDIWIESAKEIRKLPFTKRLYRLNHILTKMYQADTYIEPCRLLVKQYFPFTAEYRDQIINYLSRIDYKVQGLCFTSAKSYRPSLLIFKEVRDSENISESRKMAKKARQPIKVKTPSSTDAPGTLPGENNLFNLYISKTSTPGIYQLYCSKVGKRIKHSIARINGLKCLQFVNDVFQKNEEMGTENMPLVICEYNSQFKKFIPKEISNADKADEYTDIIFCTGEKMQE